MTDTKTKENLRAEADGHLASATAAAQRARAAFESSALVRARAEGMAAVLDAWDAADVADADTAVASALGPKRSGESCTVTPSPAAGVLGWSKPPPPALAKWNKVAPLPPDERAGIVALIRRCDEMNRAGGGPWTLLGVAQAIECGGDLP